MSDKTAHLDAMGIERWRLRDPSSDVEEALSAYCIRLFDQAQCVGVLLAEGVLQTEAEANLVQAMAKATAYVTEGAWESSLPPLSELAQPGVMLVLGAGLASSLLHQEGEVSDLRKQVYQRDRCSVIMTYSPAELLADTSLKALAWHDIKQAMQLMRERRA